MSLSAAHFPHQGEIQNPTIDDYRTELSLIEAEGLPFKTWQMDRWQRLIRRLRWMQDAKDNREVDDCRRAFGYPTR